MQYAQACRNAPRICYFCNWSYTLRLRTNKVEDANKVQDRRPAPPRRARGRGKQSGRQRLQPFHRRKQYSARAVQQPSPRMSSFKTGLRARESALSRPRISTTSRHSTRRMTSFAPSSWNPTARSSSLEDPYHTQQQHPKGPVPHASLARDQRTPTTTPRPATRTHLGAGRGGRGRRRRHAFHF